MLSGSNYCVNLNKHKMSAETFHKVEFKCYVSKEKHCKTLLTWCLEYIILDSIKLRNIKENTTRVHKILFLLLSSFWYGNKGLVLLKLFMIFKGVC